LNTLLKRYLLIFHRDGIWHESLMSACENMEEKTAADVKRCLLVRWTYVEEDDQVREESIPLEETSVKGAVVEENIVSEEGEFNAVLKQEGDNEEEEVGNETGGSLINRGIKFASQADFLSFMKEDESGNEEEEKLCNSGSEEALSNPVVRLKRLRSLSLADMEKSSQKRSRTSSKYQGRSESGNQERVVWECEDCGKRYKYKKDVYKHQRKHGCKLGLVAVSVIQSEDKRPDLVDIHAGQEQDNRYHCKLCDYSSERKSNIRIHLEGRHNLGVGWDCERCGRHFKSKRSLKRHKCNQGQSVLQDKSPWSTLDLVKTHARLKEDNKYQCNLCDYSSENKGNMRFHLEGFHSLGAGWDCEQCHKHFKLKQYLLRHKCKQNVIQSASI